ncbi:MAG: hypothetical protein J3K34DRAFT_120977 [Monoraphidium minutum]|nr:MAG: hypothetical protein J3K34DRAFT_120977 [Monoraphidium minutum]
MERELEAFEAAWRDVTAQSYWDWDTALNGIVTSLTPTESDHARRAHVIADLNAALSDLGLHVRPFGSTLSNMGFPDSDVDLLLAGDWRGGPPYLLPESGRKNLLRRVGALLYERRMVRGPIEFVLHARVPLIKFVHWSTGVECDLTLQSYDGALKGRFMAAIAQLDTRFPALFRLVKLWARTHECNDASQSTFNSTALMYMVIFFLQTLGVLPPLRALCPDELARLPRPPGAPADPAAAAGGRGGADEEYEEVRLLDPRLRSLWVRPAALDDLIAAVEARAAAANERKRAALSGNGAAAAAAAAGGDPHAAAAVAAVRFELTQLLAGFLLYWEAPLAAWGEGRLRDWRPDVWNGGWRCARFSKAYLCPLEDPFDATDNPARSIGSASVSPGGQHLYIAAAVGSNAAALRRLLADAGGGGGGPGAARARACCTASRGRSGCAGSACCGRRCRPAK